jgi:hypothetical protein
VFGSIFRVWWSNYINRPIDRGCLVAGIGGSRLQKCKNNQQVDQRPAKPATKQPYMKGTVLRNMMVWPGGVTYDFLLLLYCFIQFW